MQTTKPGGVPPPPILTFNNSTTDVIQLRFAITTVSNCTDGNIITHSCTFPKTEMEERQMFSCLF